VAYFLPLLLCTIPVTVRGQAQAGDSDAAQRTALRTGGTPALQGALQRVFSNWRAGYLVQRTLVPPAPNGRSLELRSAAKASLTQPAAIRRFRPLALVNDNWVGPTAGNWSVAANWSGGVPNNGTNTFNVFIDNGKAQNSAVTLDLNAGINNLTIDSGDSLSIANARILTINGTSIANAGSLSLNSSGNFTELVIAAPNVTLSGGGTLTLSNNANNFIFGASATDTLTNKATITGAGHIGNNQMTLVNSGTINASQSAGLTIQANGGTINTGTIKATGGPLVLTGMTVTNTGGTISDAGQTLQVTNAIVNSGNVTLTGAGALQLTNGVIHGGTLTNSATGTIEVLGGFNNVLGGTITNPAGGMLKIDNNTGLNLESGSYSSLGAVQLNSSGNFSEFIIDSNVTLSGGSVTMSNNANNFIFGQGSTDTLTNQETISGAGHIGNNVMTLVNSGTINASQAAGMTIQANGGATNTGTIEATAGPLVLTGMTVNNAGGTISSSGQTVQVTNTTIDGGNVTLTGSANLQLTNGVIHGGSTLSNSSTGTMEILGGFANALGGTITNPAGGLLKIDNNTGMKLESGTYTNLGTVQLNSAGNFSELIIGSNVTLSGGTVTMSNNINNFIFGANSANTLTNQETISGAGHVGDNQMTLVNSGTINASQAAGMIIQANGGATNTGTIEATAGPLTLTGMTTVNNAGGTISASGQTMQVTNTAISGGHVTLTGSANLQLTNAVIHGGTLTNSATGTVEVFGGFNNFLGGTITNPAGGVLKIDNNTGLNLEGGSYSKLGAVQLNSSGNFSEFIIDSNVTLSGGSVTMSNNANNFIFGEASSDTLTNQETISGAGHIGDNAMTLVNSGTINASQSAGLTIQANGGATNTGTIEATAGPLVLTGMTLNNAGGTISDSGQTMQVNNATVNGGKLTLTGAGTLQLSNGVIHGGSTLANSSTGTIEILGGFANVLGGTITNPAGGVLKIDNNTGVKLESGTYANLGAVQLNSSGNFTELIIGSNVTLSGGSVTMSNSANNFIFGTNTTNTLTNQETIQGSGNISNAQMGFVNTGTVLANQSTPLIIQPSSTGFTNTGTLSVSSGDTLHVKGGIGTFTNFAGGTLTGGTYTVAGTLQIDQLGSGGGEILTNAAKITLNGAASAFTDSTASSALSNLNTNTTGSAFTVTGGQNFTTAGNFTNNGALTVGAGSKFTVNGNLTNFSGTTLTGGTYSATGTLQFNGANVVTNAANVTLNGAAGKIINQSSVNAFTNFTTNAAAGSLTLSGGQNLTTAGGSVTNAGSLTIGTGSTLTVGGSSFLFTQTGGTSTIDGTLTSSTASTFNLNGGSLFGGGTVNYSLGNKATVTPGDSATKTGILNVSHTYTQGTAGVLNISIGGNTVGTQFDQLNVTSTAALGGTLNISLINGFVPAIGSTFDILNGSAVSSNWATINGLSINASEHFTETVNSNDVILTVVSGASPVAATSLISRSNKGRISFGLVAPHRYTMAVARPAAPRIASQPVRAALPHVSHFGKASRMMDAGESAPVSPTLMSAFSSAPSYSHFAPPAASSSTLPVGRGQRRVEVVLDVNSVMKTSPRKLLKAFFADPDSNDAVSIGYVTTSSVW
jgi:filamentous hemagglutinin